MKQKTNKKVAKKQKKASFKLAIANQPSDIQHFMHQMIESDSIKAMKQLQMYWLAMTAVHLEWGQQKAAKELSNLLNGMIKGIVK